MDLGAGLVARLAQSGECVDLWLAAVLDAARSGNRWEWRAGRRVNVVTACRAGLCQGMPFAETMRVLRAGLVQVVIHVGAVVAGFVWIDHLPVSNYALSCCWSNCLLRFGVIQRIGRRDQ